MLCTFLYKLSVALFFLADSASVSSQNIVLAMNVGSVTEEDVYIALVVVPIIVTVYCPLLLQTPNRILKVCTVSGTFQKKFFWGRI